MDGSSIGCGGFLCGTSGGVLDLELHRPRQTQLGHQSHAHEHGMNPMEGTENDLSVLKGLSMNINKGKTISPISYMSHSITSEEEEDEPAFAEDGSGWKKASPWHRMKWTGNVVRLLIAVVADVGDDGTLDCVEGLKRKLGTLQKKGKWKAVSKIMISKGCCVSPQQCEDKFNDLNKRYKRLNEILGRGTTCQVVENPALLDSMSQLSPKVKDDVRKLLNSKHLFYEEMCAYHNGKEIPICHDLNVQGCSLPLESYSKDNHYSEGEEVKEHDDSNGDDDDNDDDDDDNDDDEDELDYDLHSNSYGNEEDRKFGPFSARLDSFEAEMAKFFQDPTKSPWGQKQWIKRQMLRLKEEIVRFEENKFELEKQHFKWLRFRSKKDQELEQSRLVNERMQLENERMLLQLKHKDFKFNSKRIDDPSNTASLDIQRPLERNQVALSRLP